MLHCDRELSPLTIGVVPWYGGSKDARSDTAGGDSHHHCHEDDQKLQQRSVRYCFISCKINL